MGRGLHFGEVELGFDDGFNSRHDNRHVIGFTSRHNGGNRDLLDGGNTVSGPHCSQHHVRIEPGGQHHSRHTFCGGNNNRQAICTA